MNDEARISNDDLRLRSAAFWQGADTHVACSPQENAAGLWEFMEGEFGRCGWCLFQTSGTEGARKWVALTKPGLLTSARAVNAHFGVTAADRWLLALPLWHVGGFGILARAFASGSRVMEFEGKWDAAAFARCADAHGATLTSLVPTQVFDLVAAGIEAPKSMRVVLVGGGALSGEIERAALALGWPVRRTYGMTETCSQVASQREAGGEMEVLPIWQVETDETDVLTVKGEALAKGCAVCEEGKWRWESISAGSGLRTRDRVVLTESGGKRLLRFMGREAGIVKILGELVALGPIQECIEALRLKQGLLQGDAAVCDVVDERKESRLVLVVSGMPPADAECLQKSLNERLRPFEQVEQICCLEAIPRGELGKVRLGELRAALMARMRDARPR